VATTVPAYVARTQLGSLLKQVRDKKARFVITKSGRPTAVLIGAEDFDNMLEELDREFRKSLKVAAKQHAEGVPQGATDSPRWLTCRPALLFGSPHWRLEVWPYRVRYDIIGQDVALYRVRHRKDVYRE
jgi:prevent-host-death family protein